MSTRYAKTLKTDLYDIRSYFALPCSLSTFTVNGFKAELRDFGETKDTDRKHAQPYCCKKMQFIAKRAPTKKVLAKYGIMPTEWREIAKALKEVLFVGECGWCE